MHGIVQFLVEDNLIVISSINFSPTNNKRYCWFIDHNECTKVQNPHYKDVTLKAYTLA